jgi:DNA-binding transcriptional regulator YdaS (Cro superfamily)
MELREWIVKQSNNDEYSCMERVYEHLSDKLGVGKSSIKQWALGHRRVAAEHVITIEKLTDGMVTRHQLRRDLYPD